MDEKLLYKVEEVGPILNMGRSTLFEKIKSGELKSVRIGRSRRITRAALEEYVAGLEQSGEPAA